MSEYTYYYCLVDFAYTRTLSNSLVGYLGLLIVHLLTPPAALPTVSASTWPLRGGIFSDPLDPFPLGTGGGGILDSSTSAAVCACACSSRLVTVCLLALFRVRMPPMLAPPEDAAVVPELPLVAPDAAVGIPVACRLFAVADGRGIY